MIAMVRRSFLSSIRFCIALFLRITVPSPRFRGLANLVYRLLPPRGHAWFHARFARLFWGNNTLASGPDWVVHFQSRRIRLPFAGEPLGTAWNAAVSLLGHDAEVRRAYRVLLASDYKPSVIFDIGANYGFDSFVLLAQNIKVISVEPNPSCHDYFKKIVALNGFSSDLRAYAIGSQPSRAALKFPKTETWLGSLSAEVQERLATDDLISVDVEVTTLDELVRITNTTPDLVKVDTEGFELEVFRGGTETLTKLHPILIFESRKQDRNRPELYQYLSNHGYQLAPLSIQGPVTRCISETAYMDQNAVNFIAVHDSVSAAVLELFR